MKRNASVIYILLYLVLLLPIKRLRHSEHAGKLRQREIERTYHVVVDVRESEGFVTPPTF